MPGLGVAAHTIIESVEPEPPHPNPAFHQPTVNPSSHQTHSPAAAFDTLYSPVHPDATQGMPLNTAPSPLILPSKTPNPANLNGSMGRLRDQYPLPDLQGDNYQQHHYSPQSGPTRQRGRKNRVVNRQSVNWGDVDYFWRWEKRG